MKQNWLELCPVDAISADPVSIDLGICTFCGECAKKFPNKIQFTTDYKISTNVRERLIVKEGDDKPVEVDPETCSERDSPDFWPFVKAATSKCRWRQ